MVINVGAKLELVLKKRVLKYSTYFNFWLQLSNVGNCEMIQLNDKDVSHCIGSAMSSKCLWHPILELASQRETEKAGTKILSISHPSGWFSLRAQQPFQGGGHQLSMGGTGTTMRSGYN